MVRITDLNEEILIPENITITIENNKLTVKGINGLISRVFFHPKIDIKIDKNKFNLI